MASLHRHLLLLSLLCFLPLTQSFWWSSSPPTPNSETSGGTRQATGVAEFTMQGPAGSKGLKAVEDAERKMAVPTTCWHKAYRALFESCSRIMAEEDRKRRLAWMLSDCFQTESGRPGFPACKQGETMKQCLKRLGDDEHRVFLEFYLETNNICHQLQSESFKHETERLVNELSKSAHTAEDKLETIIERSSQLIQESSEIHDSLASLQEETQEVARESKDVKAQVQNIMESSLAIFQLSKTTIESQLELKEAQVKMKDAVSQDMNKLLETYEGLGKGMENLMKETVEIEREVKFVGESMFSKMQDLQGTANSIESVAGSSLEKQMRLMEGQSEALEGLDSLRKFQSEAIRESRETLERFSEYGHKQHEELLKRQDEIQKNHDHLYQTSQAILEAQREFELKQSDIFNMLEKLYVLYKAILDESRFIKAFFFYSCIIILLHMLTSAKQTFPIRAHLYLGLCITLLAEIAIIKVGNYDIIKRIWIARSAFLIVAALRILHSVFTFKDYEIMSHQLLETLMQKICALEKNSGNQPLPLGMDMDDDDSFSDYSWIDEELPEDVGLDEDPNYYPEEVAENFNTTSALITTKSYYLRSRSRSSN